jgi:transposase-like protein
MYNCEKCGKEFNKKTQYTQHQKRKTPCIPLFSSVINKSIILQLLMKLKIIMI